MDVVAGAAFSVDIDSINRPSDPFVTNMKRLLSIYSFKNPLLIVIGISDMNLSSEYLS